MPDHYSGDPEDGQDQAESLDISLRWEEDESSPLPSCGEEDSLSLSDGDYAFQHSACAAPVIPQGGADGEESAALQLLDAEKASLQEDFSSDEEFQWALERDQTLENALRITQEVPFTAVYHRLMQLRNGLASSAMAPRHALFLLDEVDQYLKERIAARQEVPTDSRTFEDIRSHITGGLSLLLEASSALRDYISEPMPLQLDLASSLCDEGNQMILESLMNLTAMAQSS